MASQARRTRWGMNRYKLQIMPEALSQQPLLTVQIHMSIYGLQLACVTSLAPCSAPAAMTTPKQASCGRPHASVLHSALHSGPLTACCRLLLLQPE